MEPISDYEVPTGGVPRRKEITMVVRPTIGEQLREALDKPKDSVGDIHSKAKGSGARFNGGKPPMDLVPLRVLYDYYDALAPQGEKRNAADSLRLLAYWQAGGAAGTLETLLQAFTPDNWRECAEVFDYGRKKYAEWNWAKGMAWSIPLGCAVRHLMSVMDGEELDAESGLSHLAHAICNVSMLLVYIRKFPEGDDRPKDLL
jgi:hypothetical protein